MNIVGYTSKLSPWRWLEQLNMAESGIKSLLTLLQAFWLRQVEKFRRRLSLATMVEGCSCCSNSLLEKSVAGCRWNRLRFPSFFYYRKKEKKIALAISSNKYSHVIYLFLVVKIFVLFSRRQILIAMATFRAAMLRNGITRPMISANCKICILLCE